MDAADATSLANRRVEYESSPLDVEDVAADPITQWWRWYDEAIACEAVEPNGAVVSTVAADGGPDARFVLVRGVDERGFGFFTNTTSVKGEQLAALPQAALTFGWLELHRQVRIRGAVELVSDAECDEYFASRPRGAQEGAWASPQSEVLASREALEALVAAAEARFAGAAVPRPPFWAGYRVVPAEVEFWQGRRSRLHDRVRFRRDDVAAAWVIERLAP